MCYAMATATVATAVALLAPDLRIVYTKARYLQQCTEFVTFIVLFIHEIVTKNVYAPLYFHITSQNCIVSQRTQGRS